MNNYVLFNVSNIVITKITYQRGIVLLLIACSKVSYYMPIKVNVGSEFALKRLRIA